MTPALWPQTTGLTPKQARLNRSLGYRQGWEVAWAASGAGGDRRQDVLDFIEAV